MKDTDVPVEKEAKYGQCEASYGDKGCDKNAFAVVVSGGLFFHLCKECAKLAEKQNKANR